MLGSEWIVNICHHCEEGILIVWSVTVDSRNSSFWYFFLPKKFSAVRKFQSILLIDSESQTTTSTIKSECGDEQSPCKGYILGKIIDSFICSHNLPEALDGKREEQQRDKQKFYETKNQRDEEEDLEMKDLLLELRSIEKKEESWSKWALEYSNSLKYDDS